MGYVLRNSGKLLPVEGNGLFMTNYYYIMNGIKICSGYFVFFSGQVPVGPDSFLLRADAC